MSPRLTVPVGDRDHAQGLANAAVTLVEYGDFQCPSCGAAHAIVKALQRELGGTLRFVFRHFPLRETHAQAEAAAEAAEAAAAQGRFWEMHDVLFEHQNALDPRALQGYAEQLQLDARRFAKELQVRAYAHRIEEDLRSGAFSGVNGTPTFFINDRRHNGPSDRESLLAAIEAAARS